MPSSSLARVDLSQTLSRKKYEKTLVARQEHFLALRLKLGGQVGNQLGPPLLILFEGWDAAGKGGCIRRLVQPLDPRHYTVHQYQAPTSREKRHHFLWRFWPAIPGRGGMCVFDRTWYGRVLVERVEGFATAEEWGRAFEQIRSFESLLVNEDILLIKIFLHISSEEQASRFNRRSDDPLKSWKLTEEDWRNRSKLADYTEAVEDMLSETSTKIAPWTVIPAESKRVARVKVLDTVIDRLAAVLE